MDKIAKRLIIVAVCGIIALSLNFAIPYLAKSASTSTHSERSDYTELPLPILQEGWQRIQLNGIGSIDIPPTMEIQSGEYREIADSLKPKIAKSTGRASTPKYDIIIQQKGLNDLNRGNSRHYARVMIDTVFGNDDDFDSLYFNLNKYDAVYINELNKSSRSILVSGFTGTGLKLVNWLPLKVETINGMSCIHISYIRQLYNNPIVVVNVYMFQNVNRMNTLTMAHRVDEQDKWEDDFAAILASFRINKAR
jgi:hypothetical protein